jgi:hypothetical protein
MPKILRAIILLTLLIGCSKTQETSKANNDENDSKAQKSSIEIFLKDMPIGKNIEDVVSTYGLQKSPDGDYYVMGNCYIGLRGEKSKINMISVSLFKTTCDFTIPNLVSFNSKNITIGDIVSDLFAIDVKFTYECPPPLGCGNSAESDALYMILEGTHVRNFESVAFEFSSDETSEGIFDYFTALEAKNRGDTLSTAMEQILLMKNYDDKSLAQWKKIRPRAVYFGKLDRLGSVDLTESDAK